MSPLIVRKGSDDKWMLMDLRDDEDVEAMVVFPLFGPDHRAGTDCWCQPSIVDEVIVHNECH